MYSPVCAMVNLSNSARINHYNILLHDGATVANKFVTEYQLNKLVEQYSLNGCNDV